MSQTTVCRICLGVNARLCTIAGTLLQLVFEQLTNSPLTINGMPGALCYICHAYLSRALDLKKMAIEAERVLTDAMKISPEVTELPALINKTSLRPSLRTIPVECTDSLSYCSPIVLNYVPVKVKEELVENEPERLEVKDDLIEVKDEPMEIYNELGEVKNEPVDPIEVHNMLSEVQNEPDNVNDNPGSFKHEFVDVNDESINVTNKQRKDELLGVNNGPIIGRDKPIAIENGPIVVNNEPGVKNRELMDLTGDMKKKSFLHDDRDKMESVVQRSNKNGSRAIKRTQSLQTAKMLIFLANGEQRLVTFTLPRESCTLQEVLIMVGIEITEDTSIQCMQTDSIVDIDYFVSAGGTRKIEELVESIPSRIKTRIQKIMEEATKDHLNINEEIIDQLPEYENIEHPETVQVEHNFINTSISKYKNNDTINLALNVEMPTLTSLGREKDVQDKIVENDTTLVSDVNVFTISALDGGEQVKSVENSITLETDVDMPTKNALDDKNNEQVQAIGNSITLMQDVNNFSESECESTDLGNILDFSSGSDDYYRPNSESTSDTCITSEKPKIKRSKLNPVIIPESSDSDDLVLDVQPGSLSENVKKLRKSSKERRSDRKARLLSRNAGKPYVTKLGKIKPGRNLAPLTDCRLKCKSRIPESERESIFKEYWLLGSYDERARYVEKFIQIQGKKSQKLTNVRTRNFTNTYNLIYFDKEYKICKSCLLKTLGESSRFLQTLCEKIKKFGHVTKSKKGRASSYKKVSEAIQHINVGCMKDDAT